MTRPRGVRSRVPRLACCALIAAAGCAKESIVLELGPDEWVDQLAASGDTLAVGIGRARHERGEGPADADAAVALVRAGAKAIRTPLERGVLRGLAAAPSGFVALRVVIPRVESYSSGRAIRIVAHVFLVEPAGTVTPLPAVERDLLGVWATHTGELFAYSSRAVVRWTPGHGVWTEVPLDPALAAGPIRGMVALDGGAVGVVTDRAIMGFARLDRPPTFVTDMRTYPYPLQLHGGGDRWWLVAGSRHEDKVYQVASDGTLREVSTLRSVSDVLSRDAGALIVSGRHRGDVHRSAFYVLDRAGAPPRGPYELPVDTTLWCAWQGAVVSGGPGRRVLETPIPGS